MRQRSISAVGVVIVGVLPLLVGGAAFAVVLTVLCLIGLHEYNAMAAKIGTTVVPVGYVALPAFAAVAGFGGNAPALLAVCAGATIAAMVWVMIRADLDGAFVDWALSVAGTMYLGLPLFAAVALRNHAGEIDAGWLRRLTETLAISSAPHPRGAAWLLLVLVATWLSDTGAYLVGRAIGRHPLIPRISPKKTVEGLVGGLTAAGITGVIANAAFGLGLPWLAILVAGLALAAIGVLGDLAESLLKRQAGIKDSGTLIPGHGGMLDRLDALLFTWTAGWFVAAALDRWW